MSKYFDALETRSADERAAAFAQALPEQIARAKALTGYGASLSDVDAGAVKSIADLASLPVLRKSDLVSAQGPGAGPKRVV